MASFVINDKVYDTDKMQLISVVNKRYNFNSLILERLFGNGGSILRECNLYRSTKGNYLLTHRQDYNYICAEAITEDEAKQLLKSQNYDVYAELFGELEEA